MADIDSAVAWARANPAKRDREYYLGRDAGGAFCWIPAPPKTSTTTGMTFAELQGLPPSTNDADAVAYFMESDPAARLAILEKALRREKAQRIAAAFATSRAARESAVMRKGKLTAAVFNDAVAAVDTIPDINPVWGRNKAIQNELHRRGIDVSDRTITEWLKKTRK